MFGILRRCPASLSRNALSKTRSSSLVRTAVKCPSASLSRTASPSARVAIAAFHKSARWQQEAQATATSEPEAQDAAPKGPMTKFQDLETRGLVHPNVIRTITGRMGLETMTEVQSRTINEALRGTDIIAQAKTGTGKTLGFLIPVIQKVISENPELGQPARGLRRAHADDVKAIIISPTRELAEQIAVEAKKATSNTSVIVQAAVGGTQKRLMLQKTLREGCHILIGTPGRLNDLLSDEYSGIAAPNLNVLVMDEADRLLEAGFQQEIHDIKRNLPSLEDPERQTMMFSATVPREVVHLVRSTLKSGFHFVKTVRDDEEPTHERVPQALVSLTGLENQLPALYELCTKAVQKANSGESRPFKAIVYFSTTAEVTLASSVFHRLTRGMSRNNPLQPARVFEIHSKLTQAARTVAADSFRVSKSGILFSSDVTARGMDFPDVTHVIQMSMPRERETYIHRLGRTARAGKEGEGWLFATPLDEFTIRSKLRGLPLKRDTSLETASVDMTQEGEVPESAAKLIKEVNEASRRVRPNDLQEAYHSLFSAYQSFADKSELALMVNNCAKYAWGLETPPPITSRFADTHRLGRVRGMNISSGPGRLAEDEDPFSDDPFSSGRSFRGSDRRYGSDRGSSGRGFSSGNSDRSSARGGSSRDTFGRDSSRGEFGRGSTRGGFERRGGGGRSYNREPAF